MVFRQNKKKITKTTKFWSQNVQLVPIKKMNNHPLWLHLKIKELLALLRDQIAAQNRHLERLPEERTVRGPPYAHRFCACDSFFDCHPQDNSKKCQSHVYGNFVWEFQVRYNNRNYRRVIVRITSGLMRFYMGNSCEVR